MFIAYDGILFPVFVNEQKVNSHCISINRVQELLPWNVWKKSDT